MGPGKEWQAAGSNDFLNAFGDPSEGREAPQVSQMGDGKAEL